VRGGKGGRTAAAQEQRSRGPARGRRRMEGRQGLDCKLQKLQGPESKAKFSTVIGF
jgi:hypothetical protein